MKIVYTFYFIHIFHDKIHKIKCVRLRSKIQNERRWQSKKNFHENIVNTASSINISNTRLLRKRDHRPETITTILSNTKKKEIYGFFFQIFRNKFLFKKDPKLNLIVVKYYFSH
jgi:hypothetical protein